MSKVEVDQVDPQSGTNLTLGTSGDSILIPSGVTLANSGTMTGVPVPTTGIAASAISSGTIATARLGSGTASSSTFLRGDQTYAEAGGGKINQVVSTHNTTTSQMSSASFADVSGQSVAITPSATNSKILIVSTISFGLNQDSRAFFKLLRGSTVIGSASDVGSRIGCNVSSSTNSGSAASENLNVVTLQYLDSPSTTDATTYKITASSNSGNTLTFNKSPNDNDAGYTARATSSITATEVLA